MLAKALSKRSQITLQELINSNRTSLGDSYQMILGTTFKIKKDEGKGFMKLLAEFSLEEGF